MPPVSRSKALISRAATIVPADRPLFTTSVATLHEQHELKQGVLADNGWTETGQRARVRTFMGSSGSGRIGDYPGTSRGGGGQGGSSEGDNGQSEDRCRKAFSVRLEDIEHSDYFGTNGVPPPAGEMLQIRQRKRLVAETLAGQSVGNLPTSYNYLASCLKEGWGYTGIVTASSATLPVATVVVDFAAIAPP